MTGGFDCETIYRVARRILSENQTTGVILSPDERRFIRHEMHRRGWMQKDLAAVIGVSQMTISSALRGYGLLPRNRIAIYQALESNPVELQTA